MAPLHTLKPAQPATYLGFALVTSPLRGLSRPIRALMWPTSRATCACSVTDCPFKIGTATSSTTTRSSNCKCHGAKRERLYCRFHSAKGRGAIRLRVQKRSTCRCAGAEGQSDCGCKRGLADARMQRGNQTTGVRVQKWRSEVAIKPAAAPEIEGKTHA